ncbi:hypothetical protein M8J77_012949 [Diaphorina citri]|nr:hypothetical protein M8J77_012949 [Diaphorina citri]
MTDDTAIAAQGKSFLEVGGKLSRSLDKLKTYYELNHLKPNPSKTEVCAFHLRNNEANRKLKVVWSGQELKHNDTPRYLGVTLDRSLTYKQHCHYSKLKVSSRNNIIKKLTGSTVLRTSAIALSFSAAEYAAPVWKSSAHAKEVDVALNEAGRTVTGLLKTTPVDKIYSIAGIAPPDIRRTVSAEAEKQKQLSDPRHPLHGHIAPPPRLKSRRSFLQHTRQLYRSSTGRKETRVSCSPPCL